TPVMLAIKDVGQVETTAQGGRAAAELTIENVHLWDGLKDPYLYTATATLGNGADSIETRFGCRTFEVDPEKGFFLNGHSYPLCGAARHQDREDVGYALTPAMHEEDMELLKEMGANTIRLAHYQHDQYFYDLCDEAGMVVWAEIPYISEHMPEANDNTASQMTELVVQNYNHPSIICWGLSNEITSSGGESEDLVENHKRLNDLCHKLDSTRPTTMAHVFMLPTSSELVQLPDIRSYNLYYGWYLGEANDNDTWFDDFHAKYPNAAIGLSEYGADANPQYQTPCAERGDYTETYQAEYHEHMLAMWAKRPYIWAMHVWNMFDFAADGRDEGGKHGINQKGLVTFNRKTKKDAFYIYKAYLSRTPFVHLCGSRYVDRTEDVTTVKVYSNQPQVTLLMDGREVATQDGDKIFTFQVPISGEHSVEARAQDCAAVMYIRKVEQPNPDYMLAGAQIINWFDREDMEVREGFYCIKDTMADIKRSPQGAALLGAMMQKAVAARGDVAQGVQIPEEMQRMMDQTPLEKMLKSVGEVMSPEDIVQLNKALCQIPKV
ncbi:glycoside hydrolase family 2 protein, partial [Ruminococcaceae bacterium OttesenSCG-928-A11]|nr:glycoside hydrolase family 2 protein [Ruminococcaceae bacterium OttesenSCG-928-A11]